MKRSTAATWHQLEPEAFLQKREVNFQQGLSADEVKQRQAEFGLNPLTARRSTPAWVKFHLQSNQALVYILLAATVVSAALGEWVAAQLLFTDAPFMNKLFHSAPISGLAWLKIIGVGLIVFVAVELKKWLDARQRKGPCHPDPCTQLEAP